MSPEDHVQPALSALEGRVLGCLLEKEVTTPYLYPLTLNALVNACNQKHNRAPAMECTAQDVEAAVTSLRNRGLAVLLSGGDSRVAKFRHSFDEIHRQSGPAQAIMTELLLRGPQTSAELRTHIGRLGSAPPAAEVEAALLSMANNPSGALAIRMDRVTGQKERRWQQRLAAETGGQSSPMTLPDSPSGNPEAGSPALESRIAALEAAVIQLHSEMTRLRQAVEEAP